MRRKTVALALLAWMIVAVVAGPAFGESSEERRYKAMWYSIAHPGLGEWYLNGWGPFATHCPQKKFWLGLIPLYGWPGYLQVKSAIDARHGRTDDEI